MTGPLDFAAARLAVTQKLNDLYANEPEHPTVLPYGFDTGDSWAPMINWDGVMGVYVWLVDKQTGALTPMSFPQFLDVSSPKKIAPWPAD